MTLTAEQIRQSAQYFVRARQEHQLIHDLPAELVPRTEDEGYAVQDAVLTWHKENENDEIGGYKAGMVSYRNREIMGGVAVRGFDSPSFAGIRKSTIFHDQVVVKQAEFCPAPEKIHEPFAYAVGPRVESEFAVHIGEDMPADGAPYSQDSVREFVAECMAGIELVDCRIECFDYGTPVGALGIADYGANWGAVFGGGRTDWQHLDLAALRTRITVNGKEIDTGTGADLASRPPGHPFEILAWMANHLAEFGGRETLPHHIRKGDLLLLGSATVSHHGWKPPVDVVCEWEELGEARARWE